MVDSFFGYAEEYFDINVRDQWEIVEQYDQKEYKLMNYVASTADIVFF